MADFPNSLERAKALDARIFSDASAISSNYADLVSLATRQAMAGMELTVGQDGSAANVMMFMQDTGSST